MPTPPGATFGDDGTPVFRVNEWGPGVEVVQELSEGGYNTAHYTPMSEPGPGVKLIMLEGDGLLTSERNAMLMQGQIAASYAAQAQGLAVAAAVRRRATARLLLLG